MAVDRVILPPVRLTGPDDLRFAPFGTCFRLDPTAGRIPIPLAFEGEPADGVATLTAIVALAAHQAEDVRRLERHPVSVQAFLPLTAGPVATILAPRGPPPCDVEELVAFVVPEGHGIAYRTGTWHAGLMGFGANANVLSFVRRKADGSDSDFLDLSFSVRIAESIDG